MTGLVLTNDGLVSIGREKKREIRAAFHAFTHGTLKSDQVNSLAGMVAFIKAVEPEFLDRLARKYGATELRRLLSGRGGGD